MSTNIIEDNSSEKQDAKVDYHLLNIKIKKDVVDFIKEMERDFPEMTQEYKKIIAANYILFLKKQHDYGPKNIAMNTELKTESDIKMSLMGIIVRMNDKMSRLINLTFKNKKAKNENLVDSFTDISVYGVIANIVNNGKWGK